MPRLSIIKDYETKYFLTLTLLEWLNIFTMECYFKVLTSSLNYCIDNKGLIINGYVFMTNHIHLLVDTQENISLINIIRDFKRHTTKKIMELVYKDNRKYILWYTQNSFRKKSKNNQQIWRVSNWPVTVESDWFFEQKLNYIHYNPVARGFIEDPIEWKYSSAKDYLTDRSRPVQVQVE